MKIRIDDVTTTMFSQAVALAQNGMMKSTIHVFKKNIFIQNMDNTILIFYQSPQEFPEPFSFFANDYEGNVIRTEEGKIVFISHSDGMKRTKVCAAPKTKYEDIYKGWEKHKPNLSSSFIVTKKAASLLDDKLSHIELSKEKDSSLLLTQRDIYSGARIVVETNPAGSQLMDDSAFNTIGIRTVDFQALFTFMDSLTFYPQLNSNWIYFNMRNMKGILATCIYDELGYLAKEE